MAWILAYDGYEPAQEKHREALTTLGNGYFATRGATTDAVADGLHYPGCYVAGLYNRLVSRVGHRDVENEDLVNVPNWLPLTFRIGDDPWFSIDAVEIESYRLELDVQHGLLTREMRFRDPAGRTTYYREERLVSMADRHQAGIKLELRAIDWQGPITIRSGLDGGVINAGVDRYKALASRHLETLDTRALNAETIRLRSRTNQSRVELALAARLRLWQGDEAVEVPRQTVSDADAIEQTLTFEMDRRTLRIEKLIALFTNRDPAIAEAGHEVEEALDRTPDFAWLQKRHARCWSQLWDTCDITFDRHQGTNGEQMKLRVHIFHLLQTISPNSLDYDVGVPARGWHGEAYRGHIFWDELFILPFLTLRLPQLVRETIRYRYRRLREARHAAHAEGYKGAMFPWQSGSNGREETQIVHLNPESGRWLPDTSHRQRHVNAAICYNIWRYWEATGDDDFIYYYGAELYLSIARFWASIATYNAEIDRYEIKGVMGPDEFHTAYPGTDPEEAGGIDNNAYTNVMVAWVMARALDMIDMLPSTRRTKLLALLEVDDAELQRWYDLSTKLKVPFQDGGIISQFDGYEDLKVLDWAAYREKYNDIHRLDRILEAEGDDPNNYQLSKQADVLMLFYLFSAEELDLLFEALGYEFHHDLIKKNIDYYLERTSHGSTLSLITHAWVLARSDREHSWHLFCRALDSDIEDIQGGTTPEGIHTGAMAGTVDLVQRNYLGLETRLDVLHFNPTLPVHVDRLCVNLRYRRHRLDVEATQTHLVVSSRPEVAPMIEVAYRSHVRKLNPGDRQVFRLLSPDDRHRGNKPREAAADG
jgi:alpha,alpha-trehalase